MQKKKIIAISGSTRAASTNLNYINAIAALTTDIFDVTIYNDIASLPHFNPDLDTENPPAPIVTFRNMLRAAQGILICTPEYAMGVPGSLKNAIDWTVSSMEFSHRPTALITASSVGQKGHLSLMETLHIIEANITPDTQLVIPFARTKINDQAIITHSDTLQAIQLLIQAFHHNITNSKLENDDI
jgi:chromate reductase, NAD(P)H dehydrogenase (quinone)